MFPLCKIFENKEYYLFYLWKGQLQAKESYIMEKR